MSLKKIPQAASLYAKVCPHGNVTFELMDRQGKVFATATMSLEGAANVFEDIGNQAESLFGSDDIGPVRGSA